MKRIQVADVSFAYKEAPHRLILGSINLEIESGEFVCLLGQSGCGKSTFLRLLAGLEAPTSGTLTIDASPIRGASLERAVVFQDYGLFPWMSAGDNILLAMKQKYPRESTKELKTIIVDMFEQVGLASSVYKKLPRELSGGMKQRCAIARSLSVDSPVLLMDEPFGALDAVTRARLQDLMLDLWSKEEEKKTVFFVTHDVDEALLLANRIVVLGQSPSSIIFECRIPEEGRAARDTQFENAEVLKLRNTLIKNINRDVERHAE